ncbi:FecR family protein [Chitinophaga tropicalis]|uniref:FecR protein domain-containing protein n=1 Tax=Chitinophaga tropicalis TaxID=2683588 RepID=A0A7K1U7H5_9BACT|nr:FecR family protein [Chitinophaga tropicalis]MVT10301.1 hypothetical protein [Chitinophaga tropicalis]
MNNIALYIRSLIIAEIEGTITPEEKYHLDLLLEELPEAKDLSEYLHKVWDKEKLEDLAIERIKILAAASPDSNKVKRIPKVVTIVTTAAACLLGIATFFWFQKAGKNKPEISLAEGRDILITTGRDTLQLHGRTITLDKDGWVVDSSKSPTLTKVSIPVLARREYNGSSGESRLLLIHVMNPFPEKTISMPAMKEQNEDLTGKNLMGHKKVYQLSGATIHVPSGRECSVNFDDGSSVLLNAHSRFTLLAEGEKSRSEFFLIGEAYINIKKNAERPVIIHLPNSTVNVLGTELNIKGNEKESVTSLVSGSVQVTNGDNTITLRPRYQAICINKKMEVKAFNAGNTISWIEPVSTLSNPSGTDIEKTFLKCYGVKLNISPSGQRNYLTLAMDRREPPEEFLQRCINMYPDLTYYYNNGAYYLK